MSITDCHNFKELLDSYLCEELAIETNHAMLRHAEHCRECRNEMAARRQLREKLQRACRRETMSAEATERLRARLRAEAAVEMAAEPLGIASGWRRFMGRFLTLQIAIPVAAALLLGVVALNWILTPSKTELNALLLDEAAGDHRTCAAKFLSASGPAAMPESVRNFDPGCVGLDKVASAGANGLLLRSAHVCGFGDRRFAHLVYTQEEHLISLLVTGRDARAVRLGELPKDDGLQTGLQQASRENLSLGAYQTGKRVVLVVSDLTEEKNKELAERLAKPVAEHLRRVENQTAELRWERLKPREWIAALIRDRIEIEDLKARGGRTNDVHDR